MQPVAECSLRDLRERGVQIAKYAVLQFGISSEFLPQDVRLDLPGIALELDQDRFPVALAEPRPAASRVVGCCRYLRTSRIENRFRTSVSTNRRE